MIAPFLPSAHVMIDLGIGEAFCCGPVQERVIDAQPSIARMGVPEIIPEGVDGLAGMKPWAADLADGLTASNITATCDALDALLPRPGIIRAHGQSRVQAPSDATADAADSSEAKLIATS